ncbi:MAG: hypothetical protein RI967_678 [Planctomycetota bacterium]
MSTPIRRFCLDCRHPLDPAGSSACPECGRAFDPRDPRSTRASADGGFARAFEDFARAAAWVIATGAVAATIAIALGFSPIWILLLSCASTPFVLLAALAALLPLRRLSMRRRATILASTALLASVVATRWPLRVMFELHRDALDRLAASIASGAPTPAGPTTVGVMRFRRVRQLSDGTLGFQVSGNAGGGIYLVRPAIGTTRIWINTNWEHDWGGGWWEVYED